MPIRTEITLQADTDKLTIFDVLADGEVPVRFEGPIIEGPGGIKKRSLVVANTNVEHIDATGQRSRITRVVSVSAEGHE